MGEQGSAAAPWNQGSGEVAAPGDVRRRTGGNRGPRRAGRRRRSPPRRTGAPPRGLGAQVRQPQMVSTVPRREPGRADRSRARRPRRPVRRRRPRAECLRRGTDRAARRRRRGRRARRGGSHWRRTRGSFSRGRRSSGVQLPCSGWAAKAQAFWRSQAVSSRPGRNASTCTPSGQGRGAARGRRRRGQHLQQHAGAGEAAGREQLSHDGQVPVRPEAQRAGTGHLDEPVEQCAAVPAPPEGQVHDQLGLDAAVGAGVVARTRRAGRRRTEEVAPARRTAVLEPGSLSSEKRTHPVGGRGGAQRRGRRRRRDRRSPGHRTSSASALSSAARPRPWRWPRPWPTRRRPAGRACSRRCARCRSAPRARCPAWRAAAAVDVDRAGAAEVVVAQISCGSCAPRKTRPGAGPGTSATRTPCR